MQAVATEMNLSASAFLSRKENAYQLRWFTPLKEVELCGHATLACAHNLWDTKIIAPSQQNAFTLKAGC